MEVLIYFLVSFSLLYFGRSFLYKKSKKDNKKGKKVKKVTDNTPLEIKYLSKKFSLDTTRLDNSKMVNIICIMDALVVSLTFTAIFFIEDLVLTFLVGITLVFVLIYALFEVLGHILKKKGYEKDEL